MGRAAFMIRFMPGIMSRGLILQMSVDLMRRDAGTMKIRSIYREYTDESHY